jgi:hypothetical protein
MNSKSVKRGLFALMTSVASFLALSADAFPIISNVVEVGGDNDANDTVVAKWTGVTWSDHANNEPVNGLTTGQPYTVGLFGIAIIVTRMHPTRCSSRLT